MEKSKLSRIKKGPALLFVASILVMCALTVLVYKEIACPYMEHAIAADQYQVSIGRGAYVGPLFIDCMITFLIAASPLGVWIFYWYRIFAKNEK